MNARTTPLLVRGIGAALLLSCVAPLSAHAADPFVDRQWGLGRADGIGASAAWESTRGAGVVVAVLDSGVQLNHPDLAANLWTNPNEIAGNGIDDDDDGYVDDVHGANIIGHSGDPGDDSGHGTHVAGIIAAVADNGIGGSGVAPAARIMAVKVLDALTRGDQYVLSRGIRYAIAHGADVINASINGETSSVELEAAIAAAERAGITVVTSAGNNGRNIDVRPTYPASLRDPNVLSVTATQAGGRRWWLGNFGSRSVELAAPGRAILSTSHGSGWERRSGTSMAAPFATGAFALLTAAHPELPPARLRDALLGGARRARHLRGIVGWGRIDVPRALRRAAAAP